MEGVTAMIHVGKELAHGFRTVRKNTIRVAEDIPEEHYGHVPAPGCRTVGQMLVHVALAADMRQEMNGRLRLNTFVGFDFMGLIGRMQAEEAKARTKAEIIELLRTQGEQFAAWLETLTPEFLAETITQGDGKTMQQRYEFISSAKEHEMHHRGQLMLIERQIGVVPHLTREFEERMAAMKAAKA
jgi:uncharacterized damage-inducible protein DinB